MKATPESPKKDREGRHSPKLIRELDLIGIG
jgi:hypothetical protein